MYEEEDKFKPRSPAELLLFLSFFRNPTARLDFSPPSLSVTIIIIKIPSTASYTFIHGFSIPCPSMNVPTFFSSSSFDNLTSPTSSTSAAGSKLTAEINPVPNVDGLDSIFFSDPISGSENGLLQFVTAGELGFEISDPPMCYEFGSDIIPMSNHHHHPPFIPNPNQQQAPFAMDFELQALINQLFNAAELVEVGNTISAHRILARLNHNLPFPAGNPLIRSAYYFKEALLLAVSGECPSRGIAAAVAPLDIPLKLSAYKAFTEISPVLQFTSFTAAQAILEELASATGIHVVDFDVGIGSHWPAFIQELSQRPGAPLPLRITAFVAAASHHPLELHLIRENLACFAADLNVMFELNFLPLESFDPVAIVSSSMSSGEAIAVNFGVGFGNNHHFRTQTLLHMIKQLSPMIVISVNIGCERSDLSFSHHFLHSFQSTAVLLDSIEASGVPPEVADKIERYLLRPRIESSVQARRRTGEKLLPWKALFASAGFVPIQFSNFAETQADCLLKKAQIRGFQVEKHQASLVLSWQQGEIALVSAWR